MIEREKLARIMLQEAGINEKWGEVWDYCLKDALQYDEEQLKMTIGFHRILRNKDQEPYATKYRLLYEQIGVVRKEV